MLYCTVLYSISTISKLYTNIYLYWVVSTVDANMLGCLFKNKHFLSWVGLSLKVYCNTCCKKSICFKIFTHNKTFVCERF